MNKLQHIQESFEVGSPFAQGAALFYIKQLEEENADLRSGEYLARVIEERDRYRRALEEIACYDDKGANERLAARGSYSSFDEPGSVQTARAALEANNEPT